MTINIEKLKQRLLKYENKYKDLVKQSENKTRKPIQTINKLFNTVVDIQFKIMNSITKNDDAKLKKTLNKIQKREKEYNVKLTKKEVTVNVIVNLYRLKDDNKKTYKNHMIEYDNDGSKYVYYHRTNMMIKQHLLSRYQEHIFYNRVDNDELFNSFIRELLLVHMDNAEQQIFGAIHTSTGVDGFKITSIIIQPDYTPPDFMNQVYRADATDKAINCKYTKYMANLKAKSFNDLIQLEYNDYLKKHFRANSCLLTAIINKFYSRFNGVKADGKRRYKELTYDYLCEILDIPNKNEDNETTLNNIVEKFFKRFKFAELCVYDPYMNLLFKHEASEQNGKLVLRIMARGSHIYILNDKLKELEQQVNYEDDERHLIKVNNKYNVMKDPYEDNEHFCYEVEDILNTIKQQMKLKEEEKETQFLKIITSADMNRILFDLVNSGYIPKISFHSFIYKISITLNNFIICVECCDNNPIYGKLNIFTCLEEYKAYHKAYQLCYDNIIKKEYLSEFHETVSQIEDTYKITPCVGYFDKHINKPLNALDERKAYTHCLKNITKIPIFNYFDVYMPYKNEPVEDLTYYIIDVLDNSNEAAILFNNKISRTYGFMLKALSNIKYKILYQRKPIKIEDVDFKSPVDVLYENKTIDTDNKKNIINKITGLLEQKNNKGALTKVFNNFNEATYYQIKYTGKIIPLVVYPDVRELEHKLDEEKRDITEQEKKYIMTAKTPLYLVNVEQQQRLTNGLTPIKDIIYCMQRLKLYNTYKKMVSLDIKPYGIKTDCIYYDTIYDNVIIKNFELQNKIGNHKIESGKYMDDIKLTVNVNELIKFDDFSTPTIKMFDDEKDTKTINKYLSENKTVLIKGDYAGVGKSTLCKNYDNKAFFVLPYNKLCQNIRTEGHDAITYNKMFGLYKDDQELKHMKKYDLNEYKTIVFDEAFLYTPDRLKRLSQLILQYPDKTFLSTGDTDQRNPIGFDDSEYLTHCMNVIFRNQIILKDIKRLVKVEDIQRWKDLKIDIFNKNMTVNDIVLKHKLNIITNKNDVKTLRNIAYFNFRCDVINNHINKNILKNKVTYNEGDTIVCRKYERSKGLLLNTNYEYKIISLKDKAKQATIKDEVDNIEYKINVGMLQTHFKLPYCLTCDSVQGLSFGEDEKVTIFDSNLPYTDRKYLWTAITRCRKLDNVYIYIHDKDEVERFKDSKISQYFRFKVENYKLQDRKANREFNNQDYINEDWIHEQINKYGTYCKFCNKNMSLYINEENNVISNITVDRINNKLSHIKTNCQLCCHHCNVSKK